MKKITQAVILAGGQGLRMRPLTLKTPKPMIRINGQPFLKYIIENLKKNGITNVVILVGYLHEQIENYFGNGQKFGIDIRYSFSPNDADTGTRIKNASPLFQHEFLLLYGDNFWHIDLHEYLSFYRKKNKKASVVVYENRDNYTVNKMLVDPGGIVTDYDKTGHAKNLNGVDIGYFILNKDVLKDLPQENFSFEEIVVKRLIKDNQLAGFLTSHKYYGLSNPQRIPLIEEYFKKR